MRHTDSYLESMVRALQIEWKRRLLILGIGAGVFVVYRWVLPAAVPFLLAWMLAEWLYPISLKIEKKTKIKKGLTGAVILTLILAAAGILLYLGILELMTQIKAVMMDFPRWLRMGEQLLDKCCALIENTTGILQEDSKDYLLKQVSSVQKRAVTVFSPENITRVVSMAKGVVVFVSAVAVTFISSILILSDMENLRRKVREYSWMSGFRRVGVRLKGTIVTYMKAQAVIMVTVAAVCAVGFWVMGSDYFLILGIVLGALDLLPIIGTGTFLYPAALYFGIQGEAAMAVGCIVLDIATGILRELMEPRLLGGKLGISPIAILAAVYLGVFLYGGWGVILGPLSFSTVYELGKEWDTWD